MDIDPELLEEDSVLHTSSNVAPSGFPASGSAGDLIRAITTPQDDEADSDAESEESDMEMDQDGNLQLAKTQDEDNLESVANLNAFVYLCSKLVYCVPTANSFTLSFVEAAALPCLTPWPRQACWAKRGTNLSKTYWTIWSKKTTDRTLNVVKSVKENTGIQGLT